MFSLNLCQCFRIASQWTVAALMGVMALPAVAQDETKQDDPKEKVGLAEIQPPAELVTVNFKERPKFPAEPQRLRRTVTIDGKINEGEWDAFYSAKDDKGDRGTLFCNWDDEYLYLGVRSPVGVVVLNVDTGGDGWLRSADNLEIVVGSVEEGKPVSVATRLLDAANSKDTPLWKEDETVGKGLKIVGSVAGNVQTIEVAIPRNMGSLVPRNGASIGLRYELLPAGDAASFKPTAPFEPHLLVDAVLVTSRVQPIPGVNPRLTLSDNKCVSGQNLFATLELLNQTDTPIALKTVHWQGLGNSANAVNSLREVNVPSIAGLKTWRRGYKTALPDNLAPGTYALTVTAETEDGKQVFAEGAFTVVEPLQVQMNAVPTPVAIIGQTKLGIDVDIFSAFPDGTRGDVELRDVPAGWELKGKLRRGWSVDRADARKVVRFNFLLPSTTPAGDYPIEAIVYWHERTWRVKQTVKVIRTDAPVGNPK
jgi:hypothetical protein